MSVHEQERLSAYLDDELSAAERAEVDAHLKTCPECAARLGEMGAVDRQARDLPLQAPDGYFQTFPGRVRDRIEAASPRRGPVGRVQTRHRLPAWTWAAAAALILAVVTPLTLREMSTPEAPAPASPAAAAVHEPIEGPAPRPPQGFETEEPLIGKSRADEVKRPVAEARDEDQDRERESDRVSRPLARTQEAPPEPGFATPPEARSPSAPPPAAAPSELQGARPPARGSGSTTLEKAAPGSRAGRLGEGLEDQVLEERAVPSGEAGLAAEAAVGNAPATSLPEAEGAAEASPVAAPVLAGRRRFSAPDVKAEAADTMVFNELARRDLAPGADADAWRQRREAWRRFALEYPESRHADEARVRVIETGLKAWRAGGSTEDLALARRDAAAYLARDDATLAQRVQRALDGVRGE